MVICSPSMYILVRTLCGNYLIAVNFIFSCSVNINTITVSLTAPVTGFAGNCLSLICSSVISFFPPPRDMIFEWFFGPNGNSSLPTGVITPDVTNISSNYTSTLEFSPLLPIHAGLYTCQFGGNQKLRKNASVTVNLEGIFCEWIESLTLVYPAFFEVQSSYTCILQLEKLLS